MNFYESEYDWDGVRVRKKVVYKQIETTQTKRGNKNHNKKGTNSWNVEENARVLAQSAQYLFQVSI